MPWQVAGVKSVTLLSVTPSMVGDVRRARQFLSYHSRTDTTPGES